MESGRIVRIVRGWDNVYERGELVAGNTARMLVESYTGPVVNYAAIGIDSWEEFGLKEGDRVTKGQVIARIGRYPSGGEMLHLEMYTRGTTDNRKWFKNRSPPSSLLNPTLYVETARSNWTLVPPGPQPGPPPEPDPTPEPTPRPAPSPPVTADVGWLVLVTAIAFGLAREELSDER